VAVSRPDLPRAVALAAALAVALAACSPGSPGRSAGAGDEPAAVVVSVIDGDTIEVAVAGRTERIRLLGIDTPESVDPNRPVECHGPEASAFTHQLLPEGTAVVLERDREARDHYGRLLAYVFRRDDGLFVNEAVLAAGEAEVLTIEPNVAYRDRLAAAADAARGAGAGLWGACPAP
jgi:micrococcal nuclease